MSQVRLCEVYITSSNIIAYPLAKLRHPVVEVRTKFDQGEMRYATDKDFSYHSDMTSHFTLKLGLRSLHTLYPKALEPIWVKGRADMLRTRDPSRTDRRTDR